MIKGELLAVDLVSVPSNRDAAVVSVRNYSGPSALREEARRLSDEARAATVKADLAEARRLLTTMAPPSRHGAQRRLVEALLRGRPT